MMEIVADFIGERWTRRGGSLIWGDLNWFFFMMDGDTRWFFFDGVVGWCEKGNAEPGGAGRWFEVI